MVRTICFKKPNGVSVGENVKSSQEDLIDRCFYKVVWDELTQAPVILGADLNKNLNKG